MAASCVSTATATTATLVTTESLTVSLSESVTTLPPITTTITTTGCALGSVSDIACVPTTATITSTIPGAISTTTVSITKTIPVTLTEARTLFGSAICRTVSESPSGTLSTSTPSPIKVTSLSESTLSNGQVTVITDVITSTPPASIVYVPPSPGATQQTQNNTDGSPRMAPIIGGVIAGFFGLLGLVLIIWFILKRRRRWDDIFDREYMQRPSKRFSLDADIGGDPKPYHYGPAIHDHHLPPPFPPPLRQVTCPILYRRNNDLRL